MRVLIFAPNGGVSLSTGGGTKVLLRMAEILADDLRQDVTVAGYHSLSLGALEGLHSVSLNRLGVRLHSASAGAIYETFRRFPFKLSPYNLLLSPAFGRWIRSAIRDTHPDIIWFHDDIPRAALPALGSTKIYLYVHYPFAGRMRSIAPPLVHTRTVLEHVNESVLVALSKRLIAFPADLGSIEIWTNSTITSSAVQRAWGIPSRVVYTYVRKSAMDSQLMNKDRLILAVGALSKGKGFHLLIDGFAHARLEGWKLLLIGHSRDVSYHARLRAQILRAGLSGKVDIMTDISHLELERAFKRASVIVNCASFEPFGLAFLEGMSYGAIPVTIQSDFSGCWTDICNRGEFGRGFHSVTELTEELRQLTEMESRDGEAMAAIERSGFFNRSRLVDALNHSVR